MSTLNRAVEFTVIFGGSQYPSPLMITANGSISPVGIGQIGLYSNYLDASATSFGSIYGSSGGLDSGATILGGTAVGMTAADSLTNEAGAFIQIHAQNGRPFGGADGDPARVEVHGAVARYVRIELTTEDYLHLDQVEIYGA